jgi:DNA polymerase III subunit beta
MKKLFSVIQKFASNKVITSLQTVQFKDGFGVVSDLENFIKFPIAYLGENGGIDINFLKKVLSKNEISGIKFTENSCEISAGKSTFKNQNLFDENFPKLPEYSEANYIGNLTIDKELKKLKNYLAKDEFRPAMCGVNWNFDANEFCSTNAHFLKIFAAEKQNKQGNITINKLFFDIPDNYYKVYITEDNKHIIFKDNNNISFYIKLVEEKYPQYKNVIPQDNPIRITINKKELIEATENSMLIHEYILRLRIKDSKVSIYSNHIDNNSEFTYEFQNYSTNESEFEIGFNPEFLLTIAKDINENDIVIDASSPSRAAIFNTNTLLMPVMITN